MNTLTVEFKHEGELIGTVIVVERTFKTGSVGFFSSGKMIMGEKRYQCQVQMVEIGSKPKADAKSAKEEK